MAATPLSTESLGIGCKPAMEDLSMKNSGGSDKLTDKLTDNGECLKTIYSCERLKQEGKVRV